MAHYELYFCLNKASYESHIPRALQSTLGWNNYTYNDDGSVAKVYQVINGMDGEHSFFSITYKDAEGIRITNEDFKYKS